MSSFHQLLVLGNGFDLECGLASTFDDFEEPRLGSLLSQTEPTQPRPDGEDTQHHPGRDQEDFRISSYLQDRGITVWDLILRDQRKNQSWFDVETTMGEWLGPSSTHINSLLSKAGLHHRSDQIDTNTVNLTAGSHQEMNFLEEDIDDQVFLIFTDLYGWDGMDKHALYDHFMDQTHRFEDEFSNYLKTQVKANPSYLEHCRKLVASLANDRLPPPETLRPWEDKPDPIEYDRKGKEFKGHPENLSILDFNYTSPLVGLKDSPTITNIHGSLSGGNIIFGIDGTDLNANDPNYTDIVKFTKTFRLMALRQNNNATIIHPHIIGRPGEETAIMKFYGHSLGPADYSYFQSLFDTVDLYESQTRLIFYYNKNQKIRGTTVADGWAAQDMYAKVNQLMTRYGETLDNENHGKNLLHKLLLEGRLSVAPCPK